MKTSYIGFAGILIIALNFASCAPEIKIWETDLYSLKYPDNWTLTNDKGIITLHPKADYGSIILRSYSQVNFPPPLTKNFIVEMHKLPVTQDQINAKEEGDHYEFYFEYAEEDIHKISKGMRKNTDLFLLKSECNSENWGKARPEIMAILNSFTFK